MRPILPIIIAAIATYMWGFLYWGLNPLPYKTWHSTTDDVAAGKALLAHFPQPGTYFVPSMTHETPRLAELMEQGPVTFIHMTNTTGRPMMDPSIMYGGFLLYLVAATLMALLVGTLKKSLTTTTQRIRFALLTGLIAAFFIDIGDAVWWQIDITWKLHQATYNFTAFAIMAFVVASLQCRTTKTDAPSQS